MRSRCGSYHFLTRDRSAGQSAFPLRSIRTVSVNAGQSCAAIFGRRCYRDARKQLNSRSDLLRQGLNILHRKLKSDELVRIGSSAAGHLNLERVSGYIRSRAFGQRATIRAEKFKSWFDDPRQPRLVLEWLRSK